MIKGITRNENESQVQYIIRLVQGIENKAYSLTYVDFFKEAFDFELSEVEGRKRFYGIKMLVKQLSQEQIGNVQDLEILQKIEEKEQELYKLKTKASDQKRENNNILKRIARAEHLIETMENAILNNINVDTPLVVDTKTVYDNKEDRQAIALFSDWHYGLATENYWNTFNKETFNNRIISLTEKIVKYGKEQKIKTLNVFLLGDLINGLIHVTTRISNEEDVITQTMEVSEVLAQMLTKFADNFEEIKVYNTLDNHSRVTANKKDNLEVENFARLITWYLKPRLIKVPNVSFVENKYDLGIIDAKVFDYTIYGVHGHQDKIGQVVQDLSLMTKEVPDYVVYGHVHHNESTEIHGVEVIVNPSLSGVDEYAKEIRKTSKPAQKLLMFDKNEGLLSTYSIRLDK